MMNLPLHHNRLANANLFPATTKKRSNRDLKQIPLADFLKPMLQAVDQSQPWVNDFDNDSIMLPVDLYEVIQAYAQLQSNPPKPPAE